VRAQTSSLWPPRINTMLMVYYLRHFRLFTTSVSVLAAPRITILNILLLRVQCSHGAVAKLGYSRWLDVRDSRTSHDDRKINNTIVCYSDRNGCSRGVSWLDRDVVARRRRSGQVRQPTVLNQSAYKRRCVLRLDKRHRFHVHLK